MLLRVQVCVEVRESVHICAGMGVKINRKMTKPVSGNHILMSFVGFELTGANAAPLSTR